MERIRTILRENKVELLGGLFVAVLFITAGIFSGRYESALTALVDGRGAFIGALSYVVITVLGIVAAPLSTLPLMPVAVTLWGLFGGVFLTLLGWTIGSVIAYLIAQRFGRPLVARLIDIRRADAIGRALAGRHPGLTVLLLRMVIPVDILSYALGLFLPMSIGTYTLATFLGMIPFAFVFGYASLLTIVPQIIALFIALGVSVMAFIRLKKIGGTRDISDGTV